MSGSRDEQYTEYVAARLPALRRLAAVLCQDWHQADELVQATLTKLYVHWSRASAADHIDAYARAMLVHEFQRERRSSWVKRVRLNAAAADSPAVAVDQEAALDVKTAVAALPPRQRATLVLRYYLDLNVDEAAQLLGCSAGTVKSQTAKALETLRRALEPAGATRPGERPSARQGRASYGEVSDHG